MTLYTGSVSTHYISKCRICQLILGICFFFIWIDCVSAAEPEVSTPYLAPISLSDIPARASAERTSLDEAEELLTRSEIFDQIENDLLDRERAITHHLVSLSPSLATASSREAIAEIEKKWLELDRSLEVSELKLQRRIGVIEQQVSRLDVKQKIWELTVKESQDEKAPDEVINLARTSTNDVAKVHSSLQKMMDRVLGLQAKVSRSRGSVQKALDRIKGEEESLLNNLTRRERPPLWSEVVAGSTMTDLLTNARRELSEWVSSIYAFVRLEYDRLVFQIFLLIVLTMILRRMRQTARTWVKADPSSAKGMSVFEKSFTLASLLVLMLTPWLYVYTPPAITDAVGLLLVLPVLVLILPLLEATTRPAMLFLATLYVVDQFRDLIEAAPLVARLIFILEMIAAIGIIVWVVRSRSWHQENDSKRTRRWQKFIRFGLNVALFLLAIATLTAIAGYVRLAVLIGSGVLNSLYLALLLIALERTAESVIRLILHTHVAQSFNVLKTRSRQLHRRLGALLGLGVVVIWILVTLDLFALQDYLWATIKGILFAEFKTGTIAISFADVLAFVVTIIVSVLFARFIVMMLDEDVYPRIKLGRGVSFAISSVAKYGIILLGFLVAVGAMGIGMDRITILLGAFGVGLGFGLQTVVNNFVSGMILIFERPIQIGDSVEIGSVKGRITRMGIRSSTVRSFEGADITVPNGTLLSDALTNWTMTDRNRRLEVAVGVAYGTDPDTVIEALNSALEDQQGILKEPAPQVVFNGFGDNSLDFLLRAWVADNDEFVSIRSKIALAMNRALNERGIEIPFPQRDIHLRSISPEVNLPGKT